MIPPPAYITSGPHLSGYRVTLGYETLTEAQDAHAALAARHSQPGAEGGWQPSETAPAETPVLVLTADGWVFPARLASGASMNEDEEICDQWQAEIAEQAPECWSDGACWESNADECASDQPTHWMPLPASPQQPATSTDEKVGR